jgi:hypothetical protein
MNHILSIIPFLSKLMAMTTVQVEIPESGPASIADPDIEASEPDILEVPDNEAFGTDGEANEDGEIKDQGAEFLE